MLQQIAISKKKKLSSILKKEVHLYISKMILITREQLRGRVKIGVQFSITLIYSYSFICMLPDRSTFNGMLHNTYISLLNTFVQDFSIMIFFILE